MQEIAFQRLNISKFFRGSMPPDPPRCSRAFGALCPPTFFTLVMPLHEQDEGWDYSVVDCVVKTQPSFNEYFYVGWQSRQTSGHTTFLILELKPINENPMYCFDISVHVHVYDLTSLYVHGHYQYWAFIMQIGVF